MSRDNINWAPHPEYRRDSPKPLTPLEITGTIIAGIGILVFVFKVLPVILGG